MVKLLWKTVWRVLKKKKKNRATILPSNPTSGYIYKGNDISVSKR